ncbi:MAG: DUF348 domain-containing protein [Anaerolineae bacterium]|nr:DUF348 domain-containing protein [Anaerolineae bacterium]
MIYKGRIVAILFALLGLTGLAAGYEATATTVTLVIDGEARAVSTHQPTVALLFSDLGMALREEDITTPALDTPLESAMVVAVEHAHPAILVVDGIERLRYVHEEHAADILALEGVSLDPRDIVQVKPPLASDPADTRFRLVVQRAVPVVLEKDALRSTFYTNAATVGEALQQNGITLYRADRVFPDLATPVQSGMHIRLERSIPVSIQVDGHTLRTRTHRNRVGEVIADLGVMLSGQDYTIPALDATLGEGLDVQVVRVVERVVVEQTPIPFETVWQSDANMELDTQGLLQEGAPGVLERRRRLRYENGQVVDRRVEGESVVLPPTNRIMGYGTMVVVRQLATEGGVVEYWRRFRMLATSYSAGTAGVSPSNPHYGYTATGLKMDDGIVAVDPRVIRLGTKVYVPGYGVGLAADTGGAIKGKRIDLGYSDENLRLWYSFVDVYLLTPVPDVINYLVP